MPVAIAMALLGADGIAFYIRFFVALTLERKVYRWTEGIGSGRDSNLTKTGSLSAEKKNENGLVPRERPDCKPVLTRYG